MSRRHLLTKAYQSRSRRSSLPPVKQNSRLSAESMARAAKKLGKRGWPWLIVLVVLSLIGFGFRYYGFGRVFSSTVLSHPVTKSSSVQAVSTSLTTPTPTPTQAVYAWQTLRTFTGSNTGSSTEKTQTFTVPASTWQITWACQGLKGVDDYLYIAIYNANGSLYNAGAQITCVAAHRVVQSAREGKGGTFYFMVDANTYWTITVQVPAA
jgi:hypothetical protein